MRFCSTIACLFLVAAGATAHAQPPQSTVFVGPETADPTRLRLWLEHAEQGVRSAGFEVVGDPAERAIELSRAGGSIAPNRLEVLHAVQEKIDVAREATARLDESVALARLAEARAILEANADLPGAAEWLCEVETAIGIVAAQMGREELAEMALMRAASLDPTRGIGAAEAPPEVVARAVAVKQRVATGPLSTFDVRSTTAGAVVFLDDVEVGPVPRGVRVPVGRHVLRVEAPGYRSYGAVLDTLEGARPPIDVLLSEEPELEAARDLSRAVAERDADRIGPLLSASLLDGAWIVEIGAGARERSLLWPCTRRGCGDARRLEIDQVPIVLGAFEPRTTRELASAIAADRDWLLEPPFEGTPEPEAPILERWYFWLAAGVGAALLSGFVVAAVILAQPEPIQGGEIIIRPDL